mmetsp:Transcript_7800/g.12409  ORF Transcript_7800/g.12409 Transcript_7800/m.12409 type:complete len:559 (+) Transcript_7800:39-1715(+)|eukprot:CAMPEP_0184292546 /NCGR_PEP_ID=MMETSP1049-20130417/4304_1 /TAXON_ID=77928 /ORGANISM="Proteomonas sulcata, Strain CCMP704" /LENGTH=558 /DNA_ID=CAMNT_0026600361 /DNA_START=34 /DNA_END=1710 /DNA_ORIENTATION=-
MLETRTEETLERFKHLRIHTPGTKQQSIDVHPERLPAHNPYVGWFHHGHKVSNADVPTYDLRPEKMPAKNPFIGMFHHSPTVVRLADGCEELPEEYGIQSQELFESMRSQAPTPAMLPLEKRQKRGHSLGILENSQPMDVELPPSPEKNAMSPARVLMRTPTVACHTPLRADQRAKGSNQWLKKGRTRSFADVNDLTKGIQTPELCGLQAILPKQAGVRVLDKVGEGTFAKVVVALNKRNRGDWKDPGVFRKLFVLPKEGDKVVLKVQKKGESAADVMREIAVHGRCSHPNIPAMYGYYEDGTNIIMILQLLEAKELKDIMNIKRMFPEEETRVVILQVARALAYMHNKNFAHRDVSTRNVLVGAQNKAYLIDLGLAVDLSESTPSANVVGTLGYVSPEAMRGEGSGLPGDVWALGCILYEMMFGFSPFLPNEVLMPTVEVPFPDPSWGMDSSPEVQDLIKKMLDKNSKKRASADDILAHPWFSPEVCAQVDALAPPLSPGRGREDIDIDLVGEGQPVIKTCLAVDLRKHPDLQSKEGDHQNLVAQVFLKTDSVCQQI